MVGYRQEMGELWVVGKVGQQGYKTELWKVVELCNVRGIMESKGGEEVELWEVWELWRLEN